MRLVDFVDYPCFLVFDFPDFLFLLGSVYFVQSVDFEELVDFVDIVFDYFHIDHSGFAGHFLVEDFHIDHSGFVGHFLVEDSHIAHSGFAGHFLVEDSHIDLDLYSHIGFVEYLDYNYYS